MYPRPGCPGYNLCLWSAYLWVVQILIVCLQVHFVQCRVHIASMPDLLSQSSLALWVLRTYVGLYTLQRSFKEMELSMYYHMEVLQHLDGIQDQVCYPNIIYFSLLIVSLEWVCNWVNNKIGYDCTGGEEVVSALSTLYFSFPFIVLSIQYMVNIFKNDTSYIGTAWLLCLAQGQGLQVWHLLCITHLRHGTTHILTVLPDDMQINEVFCDYLSLTDNQ